MASIVLDNSARQLTTGINQWSSASTERYVGGGAIWPDFAIDKNGDTGVYGTLSITFQGTSVAFIGNTPPPPASQYVYVSIDGGIPYNTSYEDPLPPTSLQWYQSPILSDTTHTINITHIAGTSVDYMVVTAGRDTPLRGERLIVDDGDSAINYKGNWTTNTGRYISKYAPNQGFPYGNSTHRTTTEGASATFRFIGTSVEVYGLFNWQSLGLLSVLYTIDGSSSTQSYDVTTSTREYVEGWLQLENTLLYSNDSLTPGGHTLTMEVTRCAGPTLALDYILYSPSFDTLAAEPAFNTTIPPLPSSTGLLTSSGSASPTFPSNTSVKKSVSAGVIVGGVVGSLLGIFSLILLFLYRKRIFKYVSSSMGVSAESPIIQPYTLTGSTYAGSTLAGSDPNVTDNSTYSVPQHKSRFDAPASSATTLEISCRGVHSIISQRPQSTYAPSSTALTLPYRDNSHLQQQDVSNSNNSVSFRSRMRRLQDLILELNNEITENGDESPKVAELRGRIAELTREDGGDIGIVVGNRRQRAITVPPPYESHR